MANDRSPHSDGPLTLDFGHEQLIIHRRYQVVSMCNDFLIGLWFLIGSVMFLYPDWVKTGTWLFVIGSAQLLIRPGIRLSHNLHLRHLPSSRWDM